MTIITHDRMSEIRKAMSAALGEKNRAEYHRLGAEHRRLILADQLRASLAIEDEHRDTLAAYEYLAEWERGLHRNSDNEPILRLRRSHRVCQTQGVKP